MRVLADRGLIREIRVSLDTEKVSALDAQLDGAQSGRPLTLTAS